jgi:hypothetical protein
MERAGHFPALEAPEALVRDLLDFFRTLRPAVVGSAKTRTADASGRRASSAAREGIG